MAKGLVVHIEVGREKRTEYFSEARISFGSSDVCDLQIHSRMVQAIGPWFTVEEAEDSYRIIDFDKTLDLKLNGIALRRFVQINDGDVVSVGETGIRFTIYSLASESALITTNRPQSTVAPFIEEAAIGAAASPERDDAKMFLKEFIRELLREVSWTTKAIAAVLLVALVTGLLYIGFAVSSDLRAGRELAQQQSDTIKNLEEKLTSASEQISSINKSSEEFKKMISLAPSLRNEYGNGVCLIVGIYDIVNKKSGKVIRTPDPRVVGNDQVDPASPGSQGPDAGSMNYTTEGNGAPLEYEFIGTGFHVGEGYIVSNRHVVQPWEPDDIVKQIMRSTNGRPRIRKLVAYFPGFPQAFPIRVREVSPNRDLDVSVSSLELQLLPENLPVLPVDVSSEAYAIGRPVISMGYPSGPDRLLAMLEDSEASSVNARCFGSRQCIIDSLSQSLKVAPLLTQGSVTDLDSRRIVHDAKTSEGGSGSPLFGQTGKVIGINFGVFTENNAVNMALPVKYAVELLTKAGWRGSDTLKGPIPTTEPPSEAVGR